MRIVVTILVISSLGGCTIAGDKWDRYKEAAHMAGSPDEIHIEYHRKGDETSFYEWRCSGNMCPPKDAGDKND